MVINIEFLCLIFQSTDYVEKALEQMKAKQVKRNPYLDAPTIRSVAKKG